MLGQRGCEADREDPVASRVPTGLDDFRRRYPLAEVSKHRPRCEQPAMTIHGEQRARRIRVARKIHDAYPPNVHAERRAKRVRSSVGLGIRWTYSHSRTSAIRM